MKNKQTFVRWVVCMTAISVALPVAASAPSGCTPSANPIPAENSLPGTLPSIWDLGDNSGDADLNGDPDVQGFTTQISFNRGDSVNFKIRVLNAATYPATVDIDIYRMGYYQGNGARRITSYSGLVPLQPACGYDISTGEVHCDNWSTGTGLTWNGRDDSGAIPPSGVYFAKVTSPGMGSSHIIFVVRDDSGCSDVLFQTSDATWQAYNIFSDGRGMISFYENPDYASTVPPENNCWSTQDTPCAITLMDPAANVTRAYLPHHAYKLSYDRPFNSRGTLSEYGKISWVFNAEYPMVRWLEANGYNVSYSSEVDTERNGAALLNHLVFLSVGHDEYWSAAQRSNVEYARDHGVHLGFFSGNEVFWKTRWDDNYRTLITYKDTLSLENVALPVNGGQALASSTFGTGFPAAAAVNGERSGKGLGNGGTWNSATPTFPQWLEVDFHQATPIHQINVFTEQDNYASPVQPDVMTTFTRYGLTSYDVQYWDGTSWQTVPGGSVVDNQLVWRRFLFPTITTSKIRVLTHSSPDGYSRITEVEAYGGDKIDPAPGIWTGAWRDPSFSPPDDGRAENSLLGHWFATNTEGAGPDAETAISVSADDAKLRFWRDTAAATVGTLVSRTLGYEYDTDVDNDARPTGIVRLATTIDNRADPGLMLQDDAYTYVIAAERPHHLTLYRSATGHALVFGAGTIQWSWGLDCHHDRNQGSLCNADGTVSGEEAKFLVMRQATVNLFADMHVFPSTLQPGLVAETASTDTAAPQSAITSSGSVTQGSNVTLTGTATDSAGEIGAVDVSTDGGGHWHPTSIQRPAAHNASWSYSWVPPSAGSVTIQSRATDDSGNVESAPPSATLSVRPAAPVNVAGVAVSTTSIQVTWTPVSGVDGYNVYRRDQTGAVGSSTTTTFTDTGLTTHTAYLYYVRSVKATAESVDSPLALATTVVFTDDPQNRIRAVDITDLRTAVNAARALVPLAPASFTDASLAGVGIKGIHVQELRDILNDARQRLQLPTLTWTDANVDPATNGGVHLPIRKVHITELRGGV